MRLAVVVLALVACGKRAAPPRERTAPEVEIVIGAPGQTTAELEAGVANPIEHALGDIAGISHIHTRITDGLVVAALELQPGVEPMTVSDAARAHVGGIMAQLPGSTFMPVIHLVSRAGAVLRFTLHTTASRGDASRWVRDVATSALERLPGIGRIDLCGTSSRRWTVAADLSRLAEAGKTITDLVAALRGHVLDLATPLPDQLADAPLVRDTATMSLDDVPGPCRAIDATGDVIAVSVFPQPNVDLLAVRETLEAKLHELVAALPAGWTLSVLPRTRPVAIDVAHVERLDPILGVLAPVPRLAQYVATLRPHDVAELRLVPATDDDRDELERTVVAALAARGLEVHTASQWTVQIRGPDSDATRAFAGEVQTRLGHQVAGRIGLDPVEQTELVPDRARTVELGISMAMLADAVRLALAQPLEIATMSSNVELAVTVPAPTDLVDRLRQIELPTASGAHVPLANLVQARPATGPGEIRHVDRMRWVGVRVAATPDQIHDALDKLATPQGIEWHIVPAE